MAITDFLKTDIDKSELESALKVIHAFKECESKEEWMSIPFAAWAKLEQLQEYLEHLVNGDALKPDTVEYMKRMEVDDV